MLKMKIIESTATWFEKLRRPGETDSELLQRLIDYWIKTH